MLRNLGCIDYQFVSVRLGESVGKCFCLASIFV